MSPQPGEREVFRPRRARPIVDGAAALVLVVLVGIAVLLPSGGPAGWGLGSRVALVGVALAGAWFLHRLASVRLVTEPSGVEVVNVLTRRRLEWAEVVGVRLSRDDAWLVLDVADGTSLAAMGVQRSEGDYAQEQASRFARMVAERSRTDGDGGSLR